MTEGTLKINTEKLLPIIKQWLYSDKDIFLRELVSNACDALSKLKMLKEHGETDFEESEMQMISISTKKKRPSRSQILGLG